MATKQPRQPLLPKPFAPRGNKRVVAAEPIADLRPGMARFQQQDQPPSPPILPPTAPARHSPTEFPTFRFRQSDRASHQNMIILPFHPLRSTSSGESFLRPWRRRSDAERRSASPGCGLSVPLLWPGALRSEWLVAAGGGVTGARAAVGWAMPTVPVVRSDALRRPGFLRLRLSIL